MPLGVRANKAFLRRREPRLADLLTRVVLLLQIGPDRWQPTGWHSAHGRMVLVQEVAGSISARPANLGMNAVPGGAVGSVASVPGGGVQRACL